MVRQLGPSPRALSALWTSLPTVAESFSEWMAGAGLTEGPQGGLQPTHIKDVARMVVSYGLYDERGDAGALTDAGQVLLATDAPENPFVWQAARRWVGLWLLMAADGDVGLSMLRHWPEAGLTNERADVFVDECLRRVAAIADDPSDNAALLDQARRIKGTTSGRRFVVHPRLEPWRELGYLTRVPGAAVYELSAAGKRLRAAVQGDFREHDADALLSDGLSRCFFAAEAVDDLRAAGFDDLLEGITAAPEPILVTAGEAPLSPLVAWIQWSLLRRGAHVWIDDGLARQIVRECQDDARGSFELKRGEGVHGGNLAWRPHVAAPHRTGDDSGAPPAAMLDPASPPPPDEVDPEDFFWAHPTETPALLWLQYVVSRAQEFCATDVDVLRRGGAATRLRQLEVLLEMPRVHFEKKRKVPPDKLPLDFGCPATHCLRLHLRDAEHVGHLGALADEWSEGGPDDELLRVRIHAAADEVERRREHAREEILAFVCTPFAQPIDKRQVIDVFNVRWPKIRELTRSLSADLVASGRWTQGALRARVMSSAAKGDGPRSASARVLDAMLAPPRSYEYTETREAPAGWREAVLEGGVFGSLEEPARVTLRSYDPLQDPFRLPEPLQDTSGLEMVRLDVTGLEASSQAHALDLGRALCDHAVIQATWKAGQGAAPRRSQKKPSVWADSVRADSVDDEPPLEADSVPLWGDYAVMLRCPDVRSPAASDPKIQGAREYLGQALLLERRATERLLTLWTIAEDLARDGRDLHGYEIIAALAKAAAIALLRRRILATHDQAVGALIALAHLDPTRSGVRERLTFWAPTWLTEFGRVEGMAPEARRAMLDAKSSRWMRDSDKSTIARMWRAVRDGETGTRESVLLYEAILTHAPLAARQMCDVSKAFEVMKKSGDANGVATIFNHQLGTARAFLSEIYDARNRIVHQGELSRQPDQTAPLNLEALVAPFARLLDLVFDELQRTNTQSLRSAWATIALRSADIASATRQQHMGADDFAMLLGALE